MDITVIIKVIGVIIIFSALLYGTIYGIKEKDIYISMFFIGIIIIIILFNIAITKENRLKTKTTLVKKEKEITIVITNKEFTNSHTYFIGTVPSTTSEKYEVSYESKEENFKETIDSEWLYNNVKIGQEIKCILTTSTKENGEIYSKKITKYNLNKES